MLPDNFNVWEIQSKIFAWENVENTQYLTTSVALMNVFSKMYSINITIL